jgi:hypothetical protein
MMMTPFTTSWKYGDMPSRFIPLLIAPISRAPMSVPYTLPRPPMRLVPPITTAAMTSSS